MVLGFYHQSFVADYDYLARCLRAMAAAGVAGCYVPLLVDDLAKFLEAFDRPDFCGYSVTIPHKEAALACAHEVDPVAQRIGAVNTLVRQPDGDRPIPNTPKPERRGVSCESGLCTGSEFTETRIDVNRIREYTSWV
jgi:hypothetical protein